MLVILRVVLGNRNLLVIRCITLAVSGIASYCKIHVKIKSVIISDSFYS
jgi:hypothetical protein